MASKTKLTNQAKKIYPKKKLKIYYYENAMLKWKFSHFKRRKKIFLVECETTSFMNALMKFYVMIFTRFFF